MLSIIDFAIIIVYMVVTIGVGIACRGKQTDADDYFTANGKMSGIFQSLLVGLSIAATFFSGISFLGYPSVTYKYGTAILLGLVTFPLAWLVLRFWFLPKYIKGGYTQPYDIIEKRLGSQMRTVAAAMYVLFRIGWMAALIYAPAVAIIAAAGLSDKWFWPIVLIIGFSSTLYTTLGGIRGVIVTDAIQFLVIAIGVILTITVIIFRLPVSVSEMFSYLHQANKLEMPGFSMNPTKMFTVWSILIGFSVSNFSVYMGDQMSLQRYLATGNIKSASRSFLINIIGVIFVLILLAGVGVCLSAWYHFMPDTNLPASDDKVFPYFVSTQLPVGIAGLLLAAILAATMSSMTSGINTLAASITLDFRGRFGEKLTPEKQLGFARKMSLIIGLTCSLIAGIVGKLGTIFEMTQALLGIFGGPLLAYMILAILGKCVNKVAIFTATALALIAGGIVTLSACANIWVSTVTFLTTIGLTLLFNSFVREKDTDLLEKAVI